MNQSFYGIFSIAFNRKLVTYFRKHANRKAPNKWHLDKDSSIVRKVFKFNFQFSRLTFANSPLTPGDSVVDGITGVFFMDIIHALLFDWFW